MTEVMDGTCKTFGLDFLFGLHYKKLAGQKDCVNGDDGGCGNCILFLLFLTIVNSQKVKEVWSTGVDMKVRV